MLIERRANEVLVFVEQRLPPRPRSGRREAVGADRALAHVVVHAQLAGDRADLPMLGIEEAANARLELGVDHRPTSRSISAARSRKSPMPPSPSRRRRPGRTNPTPSRYTGPSAPAADQLRQRLASDPSA